MQSISKILPSPKVKGVEAFLTKEVQKTVKCNAPIYTMRNGWVPRSQEDFGDGGAFPEIHVAQYPQGIGKKHYGNTLPMELDNNGKIKYDVISKQGHGSKAIVHTGLNQVKRKDILENDPSLEKPGEEEVQKTKEETKKQLDKLIYSKTELAQSVKFTEKAGPDKYVRFTPVQQGPGFSSGSQQRIVRMVEAPIDPMEPPKFRHKKIPAAPGSPPPPVLHSPPRKVTKEEQAAFTIPPCVSNWKNAKGYTIPLEKRLVDGRGLQEKEISSRFAEFSAIMNRTVKQVSEGMRVRRELENELQKKEKEQKEKDLLKRAAQARNERAGISNTNSDKEESELEEEAKKRDTIRNERRYERQRERRLKKASVDKQNAIRDRDKDRDISEQIALGKSIKMNTNGENMFDSRLFNQTKGMTSGFGHEDSYNVYDKPLFHTGSNNIYKPKVADDDMYGDEDIAKLKKHKFVADKSFNGADEPSSHTRDGPVQFEKEEDDDVFGLDALLNDAMTSKKK